MAGIGSIFVELLRWIQWLISRPSGTRKYALNVFWNIIPWRSGRVGNCALTGVP